MTLDQLLPKIYEFIIEPLLGLVFGIAFVIFIWGIVVFLGNSDSEEARKKGKSNIMWGLVGMVIMVSALGIAQIIAGTIGADIPDEDADVFQETIDQVDVE